MPLDDQFFIRADQHIKLANDHLQNVSKGKTSASLTFATARFNAWVSLKSYESAEELQNNKEKVIEFFLNQYKKMLNDSINECIENFDQYKK